MMIPSTTLILFGTNPSLPINSHSVAFLVQPAFLSARFFDLNFHSINLIIQFFFKFDQFDSIKTWKRFQFIYCSVKKAYLKIEANFIAFNQYFLFSHGLLQLMYLSDEIFQCGSWTFFLDILARCIICRLLLCLF